MATPRQVTMTLAALATTNAAPRSGEDPDEHAARIFAGINSYLTDSGLATGGTWAPVWLALTSDSANLCYIAKNSAAGTNEFAVSIRGTSASVLDILEDFQVGKVVPFTAGGSPSPVTVSKGAMDAFNEIVNAASPQTSDCGNYPGKTLTQALTSILGSAPKTPQPTVYVTGHSLGGCVATMVSLNLQAQTWSNTPAFAVYTFAAPTAGLADFAQYFTSVKWAAYERTVNAYDMVPQAWVKADLNAVAGWYPSPGPAATDEVKGIIDLLVGSTHGNAYVQPGSAILFNDDPGHPYPLYDPSHISNTLKDFLGQMAFQHANNTYLTLLGAPVIPAEPSVVAAAGSRARR